MAEFIGSPVTLAFRAMNKLVSLPVFLLGFPSSHLLLYAADIAIPVKPISEWQATSSEATYWFLAVEFVHNLLCGNYPSTSPLLTLPSYHRYLMFVVKVLFLYASCVIYYLLFIVILLSLCHLFKLSGFISCLLIEHCFGWSCLFVGSLLLGQSLTFFFFFSVSISYVFFAVLLCPFFCFYWRGR